MKLIGKALVLMSLFVLLGSFPNPAAAGKKTGGAALSAAETEGLLLMREEEKVARDVYLNLYEKWGLNVFYNIADSEQQHMDAILSLLDKYNIADPASAEVGEFNNPDLQIFYDNMMMLGETLSGALKAGVAIEEEDITDLTNLLGGTDKADIIQVYTNLRDGSISHLEAFESHLQLIF